MGRQLWLILHVCGKSIACPSQDTALVQKTPAAVFSPSVKASPSPQNLAASSLRNDATCFPRTSFSACHAVWSSRAEVWLVSMQSSGASCSTRSPRRIGTVAKAPKPLPSMAFTAKPTSPAAELQAASRRDETRDALLRPANKDAKQRAAGRMDLPRLLAAPVLPRPCQTACLLKDAFEKTCEPQHVTAAMFQLKKLFPNSSMDLPSFAPPSYFRVLRGAS